MKTYEKAKTWSRSQGDILNQLLLGLGLGVAGLLLAVTLKSIFLAGQQTALPLPEKIKAEEPIAELKPQEESTLRFADQEIMREEFVVQKNLTQTSPAPTFTSPLAISDEPPEFISRLEGAGIVVNKVEKIAELSKEHMPQEIRENARLESRDSAGYFKFPYLPSQLLVMTREGDYLEVKIEQGREEEAAKLLAQDKDIVYAVPNTRYEIQTTAFPDRPDPGLDYQWSLLKIEVPQVWDMARGENIKIAVLDSGIDLEHPDLRENIDFESSYDYVAEDALPDDETLDGHGTRVAGVIAAVGDNGLGIYGVAPRAKLMVLKVVDATGTQTNALQLSRALMQAVGKGAGVINISFGSETDLMAANPVVEDVFNTVFALGIPVVASAGNHREDYFYPAAYEPVIAVGGSNKEDGRWITEIINPISNQLYESAVGEHIDLAAPAEQIFTTARGSPGQEEAYAISNGTSMSAALVSGVCGLLLSYNPNLAIEELSEIIKANTDPLSVSSNELLGEGRVNAFRALEAIQIEDGNVPPIAKISAEPLEGNAPLEVRFSADGSTDPDGSIADYAWSFGDGEFVNQNPHPTHTYQYGGKYDVVLMVKDNQGAVDRTRIEVKVEGEGQGQGEGNNTVFNIKLTEPPSPNGQWVVYNDGQYQVYYDQNGNPLYYFDAANNIMYSITVNSDGSFSYTPLPNWPSGQSNPAAPSNPPPTRGNTPPTITNGDPNDPEDEKDDDGDGMSNAYERRHGFNPNNADSNNDGIGDGIQTTHLTHGAPMLNHNGTTWTLEYGDGSVYIWNEKSQKWELDVIGSDYGCFVAGTKILSENGLKKIEAIKLGERVLSKNEATGRNEYSRAIKLFSRYKDKLIALKLSDGSELRCSEEHPFYIISKGWVKAGDTDLSDRLVNKDGKEVSISSKVEIKLKIKTKVYNLEVDGNHNYYVGEEGILAHNKKLNFTIPGQCFIAGTLVKTDKDLKPIELIETGERVLSHNGITGKSEYKLVIDTLSRVRKDMMEVKVEGGDKFTCSREHRFYVKGRGWVEIDKVKKGEIFLTSEGKERKLLKSRLLNPEEKMRVFNLTVADNQNYYVGREGILVHNTKRKNLSGGGPSTPKDPKPKSEPLKFFGEEPLPPICFLAGTQVITAMGLKDIEDIRLGDKVLSYNEVTGKNEYSKAVRIFSRYRDKYIDVKLSNGTELKCTAEHPFYVIGNGWVKAGELRLADKLVDKDGKEIRILSKRDILRKLKFKVYNMEVDRNHNYYVGQSGVLVHNKGPKEDPKPPSEPLKGTLCFIAGTLVKVREGLKPIELIEKDEKVLSYNEATGKNEYKLVVDTLSRVRKDMMEVKVEGGDKFTCSREHRFYVKGRGWVRIDEVKIGEKLITHDGKGLRLIKAKLLDADKKMRVFNMTVADNQNYYVGREGILVHNRKEQPEELEEPENPPSGGPEPR
jgi:PKD repeat protein